jgi:DNA polymerase-4
MHRFGIQTGADLRAKSEAELTKIFRKSGSYYYRISRGIDDRPVRSNRIRKSIGKERTFGSDLTDLKEINEKLNELAEQIAGLLKKREIVARTLTLKVKYSDFTQITRAHSHNDDIQSAAEIIESIPDLIEKTELGQRPCRLLGLSLSNLKSLNENKDTDTQKGVTRDFWSG